jgi:hypothetical protein
MPADAVPGATIPEDTEAEVLLRDGTWTWAQVIGQCKDRRGRWCIGLRWYASPSVGGREGWYLCHPGRIRRPTLEGCAPAPPRSSDQASRCPSHHAHAAVYTAGLPCASTHHRFGTLQPSSVSSSGWAPGTTGPPRAGPAERL